MISPGPVLQSEALSLLFPFEPGDSLDSDWLFEKASLTPDETGVVFLFSQNSKVIEFSAHANATAKVLDKSRRFFLSYKGKNLTAEDESFLKQVCDWIKTNDQEKTGVSHLGALVSPPDTSLTPEGHSLDFSISNLCNNNCVFCTNRPTDVQALEKSEVFRRLDLLRTKGQSQIEFSAMEPTLRPDLPEILAHARLLGFSPVHVITNGHRLKDRTLAFQLVESGMSKVTISFHAHEPEMESMITRNPKSFHHKVDAIRHLQEAYAQMGFGQNPKNIPIFITSVINRLNVASLPAMLKFFHSLGIHRIAWYFPRHTGAALKRFDEVVPTYAETREPLLQAIAYAKANDLLFRIQDLPPCVLANTLQEAEDILPWLGIRLQKSITAQRPKESMVQEFLSDVRDEKSFGPPCEACVLKPNCEGVFSPYLHRRGWGEFKGISN